MLEKAITEHGTSSLVICDSECFYFRATSTTNVMILTAAPLTRPSERELDGSKKRATSASGLYQKPGEGQWWISILL
jgi:hypothetical protein